MISKYVPVTQSIQNPDISAVKSKNVIDIAISDFDISASSYSDAINLNYQGTETTIFIENFEQLTVVAGSLYYTPVYTETIDYEIWKKRINKSFRELGIS